MLSHKTVKARATFDQDTFCHKIVPTAIRTLLLIKVRPLRWMHRFAAR